MKKIVLAAVLIMITMMSAAAGMANEKRWISYDQTVTVEFASADQAQKAELTALEMPVGKKIAVGSRWDDTNYDHLFMAKTLSAHGWKGTFLLNRLDSNYVNRIVKVIKETGSSVGAHTIHHPHLETVPVNELFYEIMANRIDIEAQTDLCVTIFTFPFGMRSPAGAISTSADQAQALIRAGIYGGPEYLGMDQRLGVKPEEFICPYLFNANDKDPNAEQFAKMFKHGLDLVKNNKINAGPCLILGVHSWQRKVHKDGFDRLGKILATESNKPEYWYCNSNEYTAWRLAFLNNKIVKKSTDGTKVTFTISRIAPCDLGALVDMGLKISPCPQAVNTKDQSVSFNADGEFMLANSSDYVLPQRIGRIDNSDNGNEKSDALLSKKIPNCRFGIRFDQAKNSLECSFANIGNKDLTDLNFTFRLPLQWEKGCHYKTAASLKSRKSISFSIPLGTVTTGDKFRQKDLFIAGQCDFRCEDQQLRLHSTTTFKQ